MPLRSHGCGAGLIQVISKKGNQMKMTDEELVTEIQTKFDEANANTETAFIKLLVSRKDPALQQQAEIECDAVHEQAKKLGRLLRRVKKRRPLVFFAFVEQIDDHDRVTDYMKIWK
jgi:hypothetical protein